MVVAEMNRSSNDLRSEAPAGAKSSPRSSFYRTGLVALTGKISDVPVD